MAAGLQQDIDRLRHAAIPAQGLFIDGGADLTVPLGGFKQSGFGRDKSLHAFSEYTDLKTAWIAL